MKEIVILSGKGGTGKTSIAASLAAIAESKVLADCDVDAADLHLLMAPSIQEENEFHGGKVAVINEDKCKHCGLCQKLCRFEAITDFLVDPIACEGCVFCANACPEHAINMEEPISGKWFVSTTRYGTLVHARLGIAQENSGKLVATVRKRAREIAAEKNLDYIISDGPPGIGCPVISSLSGADLALLITEPTLSGIHDLERVAAVCRHFGVSAMVCINKYDLDAENCSQIETYCRAQGLDIVSKIPYDNIFTTAMVKMLPVVEYSDGKVSQEITALWRKLTGIIV